MPLWLRSLVILLPLAGLAYVWQDTHRQSRMGVEWEVPVSGYDPRDLLRGHYIMFRYDWPIADSGATMQDDAPSTGLCLIGRAPHIVQALPLRDGAAQGQPHPACAGMVHAADADLPSDRIAAAPLQGRLYVAQDQAADYQARLANPRLQATLHFRLRPNGVIVPLRLDFSPRP